MRFDPAHLWRRTAGNVETVKANDIGLFWVVVCRLSILGWNAHVCSFVLGSVVQWETSMEWSVRKEFSGVGFCASTQTAVVSVWSNQTLVFSWCCPLTLSNTLLWCIFSTPTDCTTSPKQTNRVLVATQWSRDDSRQLRTNRCRLLWRFQHSLPFSFTNTRGQIS